jgi:pimeloyl-ACP methyl ester carboxylesterase
VVTVVESVAEVIPPVSFRQPGLVLTDHRFRVPLDYARPNGERIILYARQVVATRREHDDLPWLVYFQGGPGNAADRPSGRQNWLDRALDGYRVLLLDQRGTGRSTPINRQTLAMRGTSTAQARYLTCFRADSIVADCEAIRPHLTGGDQWAVLGQSFGGFCAVTYLSRAPEGLAEVVITGGLPDLNADADAVYRAAYPRMRRKTLAHYRRYPDDEHTARRIANHLSEHDEMLTDSTKLTVQAFQQVGIILGAKDGSHRLHYLLEDPFVDTPGGPRLSDAVLETISGILSHTSRPLYAVLHEAIYAQGGRATRWAAERVRAEYPEFDGWHEPGARFLFTGETVHPWMFQHYPALQPLRETAQLLAEHTDWPRLYDPEQLARNTVPVAAVIYHDDLYVDTSHSLRTAEAINSLRPWITNEYEHDGLRASGRIVLDKLLQLIHDEQQPCDRKPESDSAPIGLAPDDH